MKKTIILLAIITSILLMSCGGFTYNGKYITTEVERKPSDEFKVGDYVVLGFENPEKNARESWLFGFNLYKRGEMIEEYFVRAETVGTRRFYLKEVHDKGLITRASFVTEPTYHMARERLISYVRTLDRK